MRNCPRVAAAAAVLLCFPADPVVADAYRCVQQDGHVSYQQIACSFDSKPLELNTRRSGWTALRPGEKRLLERYRRRDAARHRQPPMQQDRSERQTEKCREQRAQLDALRDRLRRGYRLREGARLHRKRDAYTDYLREFCS